MSADETLVLFELLQRWDTEDFDLVLQPGEQAALWALSAALERVIDESFDPRYMELVQQARLRLQDRESA